MDNEARMSRLERALAERPSRALSSSLKSLIKVRADLEEEFREIAAVDQVDVFSYRLFEAREHPTMRLLGRALDSFQDLFSVVYSAIQSGRPKDTRHMTPVMTRDSSFNFSYAFAGSVGFVFTMPNDRILFGQTKLDETMGAIFSMANATRSEDIKAFARSLGHAPVRAIFQWADSLCASSAGADIQWKKDAEIINSLILQPSQIANLRNLIDLTTDLEIDEYEIVGSLVGYDSKSHTFRFAPADGELIRGKVSRDARIPAKVSIPERYAATIKTSTRMRYSTEEAEINHSLLALK